MISKIFEIVMYKQLLTKTASNAFIEKNYKSIDLVKYLKSVFLELPEAFDSFDLQMLAK